jgi:hypothetical protein
VAPPCTSYVGSARTHLFATPAHRAGLEFSAGGRVALGCGETENPTLTVCQIDGADGDCRPMNLPAVSLLGELGMTIWEETPLKHIRSFRLEDQRPGC